MNSVVLNSTVEHHLSELIRTASHPDMQKIRIIGYFFENRLHWHFEAGKKFLQKTILGYIFIYVQIKHYSPDDDQFLRFGTSLSNLGTPLAVTVYSMYLRLNHLATPDLKL